eukprot:5862470-Prymnesium_polylepis.1
MTELRSFPDFPESQAARTTIMPATIECSCGGVKLTLPNPTPKGCCHCAPVTAAFIQRRGRYISNNGSPPPSGPDQEPCGARDSLL